MQWHRKSGRVVAAALAALALAGCATLPAPEHIRLHVPEPELTFGVVADTQIQNRQAWAARTILRSPAADRRIAVTIRPPALDATARQLLEAHLGEQRNRAVSAVFYLGDGANQGCTDELAGRVPGQEGVLPMLSRFRSESGIPVFFVLGNHDFLAAGNTENRAQHVALCGGERNVSTKADLIRLVDAFNRESAAMGQWVYRSSPTPSLEAFCSGSGDDVPQSRRPGCYYAATLDLERAGRHFRFLLLDTNDYADVTRNRLLRRRGDTLPRTDFEGLRGALSFVNRPGGIESQTSWVAARGRETQLSGAVPHVLVALTHYDVHALRKTLLVPLSRKSQLLGDVFTGDDGDFFRERAFVVSAHTHTARTDLRSTGLLQDRREIVRLEEVNIGSTTDHPSLSAVLRIAQTRSGTVLSYEPLSPTREGCDAVARELDDAIFPRPFLGRTTGGRAIAYDPRQPLLYHEVSAGSVQDVFANIDWFVGSSARRAVCLGLMAGAVEAGAVPLAEPEL